MALEKKLAIGVMAIGIGLGSMLINPNFQAKDFKEPQRYFQKATYDRRYDNSGLVYAGSAALAFGGAVGTAYRLLTGRKED